MATGEEKGQMLILGKAVKTKKMRTDDTCGAHKSVGFG
jgi:hypothetical protein